MEIILVTWDSGEKIAYPYEADTLLKLTISYDCSSSQIENIEIIKFLGSLYQPQDKIQELPFNDKDLDYIVLSNHNSIEVLTELLDGFLKKYNLKIELPLTGSKLVNFEYSR